MVVVRLPVAMFKQVVRNAARDAVRSMSRSADKSVGYTATLDSVLSAPSIKGYGFFSFFFFFFFLCIVVCVIVLPIPSPFVPLWGAEHRVRVDSDSKLVFCWVDSYSKRVF